MRAPSRWIGAWWVALAGLASAPTDATELRARLERNPIHVDESVRLVLEIPERVDGASPDVTPLEKDFTVISQSRNSEVRLINGRQSFTTQWYVELAPKRMGTLVIPEIDVGSYRSVPVGLTVLAARPPTDEQARDIFVEADVEPASPYVQSQLRYSIRFYRAVDILDGTLSEPAVEGTEVYRLGGDLNYKQSRNGRDYRVIERRYAIIPLSSGELVIPPATFIGEVADPTQASSALRLFTRGRRVRESSDETRVPVRKRPDAVTGQVWLPARSLHVSESWSTNPPALQVGEPITRTLRIEAKGLKGEQLPAITMPDMEGVRHYEDQPVTRTDAQGEWIRGLREQRVALVPNRPGTITLPEIRVRWWDLVADTNREALIPARRVRVAPAALLTPLEPVSPRPDLDPSTALETHAREDARIWRAISAALLALWVITMSAWWLGRRRGTPVAASAGPSSSAPPTLRQSRQALRRACLAGEPAAARAALMQCAAALWPRDAPHSLPGLASRLRQASFSDAIERLDRALYANGGEPWRGDALWALAERMLVPSAIPREPDHRAPGAAPESFPPLYPR